MVLQYTGRITQVTQAQQVHKEQQVLLDRLVHRAVKDLSDLLVRPDHRVRQVLKVHRELLVSPDHLVRKDLSVLLVRLVQLVLPA